MPMLAVFAVRYAAASRSIAGVGRDSIVAKLMIFITSAIGKPNAA